MADYSSFILNNIGNRILDKIWNYQVKKRYHIPDASHLSVSYDECNMVLWNKEDVPELVDNCTIIQYEKLFNEWKNAENKRTVINPIQHQRCYNILVDVGLNKIATGAFGTGTSGLQYLFGDSATSEVAGNTAMGNKVLAKAFASAGDKGTTTATKTAKYLMPVTSADYTGDIKEAGLATGITPPSTGTLITRYTFPTITIANPTLLTAMTTIVFKNGTVS